MHNTRRVDTIINWRYTGGRLIARVDRCFPLRSFSKIFLTRTIQYFRRNFIDFTFQLITRATWADFSMLRRFHISSSASQLGESSGKICVIVELFARFTEWVLCRFKRFFAGKPRCRVAAVGRQDDAREHFMHTWAKIEGWWLRALTVRRRLWWLTDYSLCFLPISHFLPLHEFSARFSALSRENQAHYSSSSRHHCDSI